MSDDAPEVRVFDSVTAAVANSAQPAPPPYAVEDPSSADGAEKPSDPEPVPVAAKPSGKRTQAKTGGTTAHAGSASAGVKAKDTE